MSQRRTEIEQALRHAGRAAKQGDFAAADRWSKTAERLAGAVEAVEAAHAEQEEAQRMAQEQAEQVVCQLFAKVAFLANAMVHAPMQAPQAFQGLIKLWREKNLGEGEEDAARAAAKIAASQEAFLDGRFEDMLPDYVREVNERAWQERRAELEGKPPIPPLWPQAKA